MHFSSRLIDFWSVTSVLGHDHTTKLIFVLGLNVGQPNLIFVLISVDFLQGFSTGPPCNFFGLPFLDFDCLLASEEEFSIVLFIIDFFADTKNVLRLFNTLHLLL